MDCSRSILLTPLSVTEGLGKLKRGRIYHESINLNIEDKAWGCHVSRWMLSNEQSREKWFLAFGHNWLKALGVYNQTNAGWTYARFLQSNSDHRFIRRELYN